MTRPAASRPAAVLFDLDGTLIDTAPDFHAGVNRLRAGLDLPPVPYAQIRTAVSEGARAVIAAARFPGLDSTDPKFDELRHAFLADYEQHLADASRLFEGFEEILQVLEQHGIPWGVVTNKASTYTRPLMRALQLEARSAATVCADEVSQTKPHPEPLFKAAKLAGVVAEDCIYVGDHVRDIEAGRRAGMTTVAAGWGYIPDDDSAAYWGADVVCQDIAAFRDWLLARLD